MLACASVRGCRLSYEAAGDTRPEPSRGFDGRNGCARHAILLSLRSLVGEADLLEEAARGAVEELGPDSLALQVVRLALDHAAARPSWHERASTEQ